MNDTMRTDRKVGDEKLTFRLIIKKYRMLFSYYLKRVICKFNWAYFLFAINIILFLFVLIPNLSHRSPIPIGSWPIVLELHGKVLMKEKGENGTNLISASGIQVQIGGYHTTTDFNGEFHILFTSQTSTNIPIIFCWSNRSFIEWISFRQGQFEKEEVFILN